MVKSRNIKSIKFARHAKKRMKDREVDEDEVRQTIEYPEFTEPDIKERTNAFKYLNRRYLRVTYKEEYGNVLVITVTIRKKPFRGNS